MEKCAPGGGQLLGNPQRGFVETAREGAFVGGTVWFPTTFERSDSAAETRPQATGLHRKPLWPKATDAFSLIHLELF